MSLNGPSIIPAPLRSLPWGMLAPLTLLVFFGATVLYSAAGGRLGPYAVRHVLNFVVFLGLAIFLSRQPQHRFRQAAYPLYGILVFLLVLVEAVGKVGGGSQRWLNLGFMQLQPSELMKPGIVLVMATFFAGLPPTMTRGWRALVAPALLLGLPAGLVIIQPDLGTGLAICFGATVVIFMAGVPLWWFISGGIAAAIAAPLAFFFALHDYQRNRVLVFLDPEADMLGTGYHITQSKIAIGSGGFFGKGLGNGSQSHLNYLPESHTDFAFATMAEEWGMMGGLFILAVFFGVLFRWGMGVARRAPDRFSQLLAAGMTCTVFFYVAINMSMVMGLAPVVGIPLPFISHGGSSMMTNMICIGAIMAVDRWTRFSPH
ncbi:rod shape-determining protein RodA [Novosphingobium sp. FSY-8]|uniref:Peptidoglycan glycosyltransferase MrdB n=1 Tax=Novosphingobium ovatum TaxID=1908523 RepID=A0ABW9XCR6_9SPHN|nr:rod shape-determining protein RodA [Novosphingobium ovatum]NBC36320.1 rod shape-determining protein RodA [Novosphingobium ovatum]